MNLKAKRTIQVITSILSIIAVLAGLGLVEFLGVIIKDGTPVPVAPLVQEVLTFFQTMDSIDPATVMPTLFYLAVLLVVLVSGISALILVIKQIVLTATIAKEGNDKRVAVGCLKLSFVLLSFYALLALFTYYEAGATGSIVPGLGAYVALGAGGFGVLLSLVNYLVTSEKPALNKALRLILMLAAAAAAVLVAIIPVVYSGILATPAAVIIIYVAESLVNGSALDPIFLTYFGSLVASFIIAFAFMQVVACLSINEFNKKNDNKVNVARKVLAIVFSAVSLVFVAEVVFIMPIFIEFENTLFSYIAIGACGLALLLAIIVAALSKKENKVEKPQEVASNEEKAEEKPVEEAKAEEAPIEEKKEEAAPEIAPAPVVEEKAEEPAKEEEPEEAKEEKPAEEPKAEEKKEEPAKKPAAKKAPAKKPAAKKEEEPAKKNTASYHISKRASDNKWQVFRAGSDKVIKLFDTKVEAEEYTKKMAENQGVSYLSHASKGKNKGRIQKK